jgi:hypothetical protein
MPDTRKDVRGAKQTVSDTLAASKKVLRQLEAKRAKIPRGHYREFDLKLKELRSIEQWLKTFCLFLNKELSIRIFHSGPVKKTKKR